MEFFETPAFTRYVGEYLEDTGLLALQLFLSDHPEAGKVMPGTGGFRKLRWGDQSSICSFLPIIRCGCSRCTEKTRPTT